MAAIGSAIDMLFRVRSDSSQAQTDIKKLAKVVESETSKSAGKFTESSGRLRDANGRFTKSSQEATQAINNQSAGFSKLSSISTSTQIAIGNLAAGAIASIISKVTEAGKAVLDYSSRLEQLRISYTTLLGSGEKANKMLQDLQQLAKSTPFEFAGLTTLAQRLLGANIEAEKIIPLITDIGNVTAATGDISQERLAGITVALTQVISKQRLSAEEAEQFAERGINSYGLIAEATGKTLAEIRALGEKGALSSDLLVKSLQKISRKKYGDVMEKQSRTFSGAMSNIKDSVMITASTAFNPLYDRISNLAVRFATEIGSQQGDFRSIGSVIAKYIGEGLSTGLAAAIEAMAGYIGVRIKEIFTGKQIIDPITEGLVSGLYSGIIRAFGADDEFVKKFKARMTYAFGGFISETEGQIYNRQNNVTREPEFFNDGTGVSMNNKGSLKIDPAAEAQKKAAKEIYGNSIADGKRLSDTLRTQLEERSANLKRAYERELGDTGNYIQQRRELSAQAYDNELNAIEKERQATTSAVAAKAITQEEANQKIADLNARAEAAASKNRQELQKIEDEGQSERLKRLKDAFDQREVLEKQLDESVIATQRQHAESGELLYQQAENEVNNILFQGLERRRKLLLDELSLVSDNNAEKIRIQTEYNQLKGELDTLNTEGQQRFVEAVRKDAEAEIAALREKNETLSIEDQRRLAKIQDNLQFVLDSYQKSAEEKLAATEAAENAQTLVETSAFDRRKEILDKEIKAAVGNQRELERLNREANKLTAERATYVEETERRKRDAIQATIDKIIQENSQLQRERYAQGQNDPEGIRPRIVPGKEENDITPEPSGFQDTFIKGIETLLDNPAIESYKGVMTELGSLTVDTFGNMANAVGGAIAQWALYGGSISKALKQALAAELAHVAGVATVNALYATALGFMRLAQLDFVGAGNAFISAGLWAALAGGSALASRAISPKEDSKDASKTISGGANNSSSSSADSEKLRTITEERNRNNQIMDEDRKRTQDVLTRLDATIQKGIPLNISGEVGLKKSDVREIVETGLQESFTNAGVFRQGLKNAADGNIGFD